MSKSYLLINEPPLTVSPTLAKIIWLDEAIVIQQVHYWLMNSKNEGRIEEGEKWVYNTYEKWQVDNFPFWSVDKIQRLFLKLEKEGLIISRQFDAKNRDMRKFYRLAYDEICALHDSFLRPSNTAKLHDVNRNTETTTETNEWDVSEIQNTAYNRGEQERPDKIDEMLKMASFAGAKKAARVDALLSAFGVAFVVNSETKEWRKLAEYGIRMQDERGWKPETFIQWVKSQDGYPQYWTCRRMLENYPKAYEQVNITSDNEGKGFYA